jgi:nitrogen fixation NifU-like protein
MIPDPETRDNLQDLYRELILDHARHPRHFGKLAPTTHTAEGMNPLCGDKLRIYLQVGVGNTIDDIAFEGSGCAISIASASLLTETLAGRGIADAMRYFEAVTRRLTGREDPQDVYVDLGILGALDGVRDYPSRVKCATLAWHALRSAIEQRPAPATTE